MTVSGTPDQTRDDQVGAERNLAEEARIRATGGDTDIDEITRQRLAARAAAHRARVTAGAQWLDPSYWRAEAERREAEAEAKRKAQRPPRAVLTVSHQLRVEAAAEVDRIEPLLIRARELVADLERRVGE
jgi:hypothetical protein